MEKNKNLFDLKNKTVILTGSAGRLGTRFAHVLSAAGADSEGNQAMGFASNESGITAVKSKEKGCPLIPIVLIPSVGSEK